MTDNATSTGERIRAARKARRMSQEALARAADCSTAYIRLIERGYVPTTSDVIPRVEAALSGSDLRPSLPPDVAAEVQRVLDGAARRIQASTLPR